MASGFEHLPADIQLQRCMRYFQKIADASHGNAGDVVMTGTHYTGCLLYTSPSPRD